ncbi:MAG: ribosome biogenesis GTPase Der [Patescibacteria group bacterium]|nr:ribosome biogenesis GTPase Der [Patescibacteria group bacterium]
MDLRLKNTPVVALVGRPNVGKSTFFNRLLERRKALTSAEEGTTRDINYGHFHWRGLTMTAIDTAGLDLTSARATEEALKRQARAAVTKADIIIMLTDVKGGVMPQDRALANELRKSKKTVLLVANKADNPSARRLAEAPEWLKLGLGAPNPLSAANGSGVGDLLDVVVAAIHEQKLDLKPVPEIDLRVAIIGRPNVGKSTLLNALAGEERVLVSEVAYTTKEPQDTLLSFERDGVTHHFLLVDTVGIRKKGRVEEGLERVGVDLTLKELNRADVAFMMIDAAAGIGLQEKKLAGIIEEADAGLITVINKWDLAEERDLGTADEYRGFARRELSFLEWSPMTFIAAKTGSHVGRLLGYALDVAAERARAIPQAELDKFMEQLKKTHRLMFGKGPNRPKVYGLTQIGTKPPRFMLVVKDVKILHPNFVRFVTKQLRAKFGFKGTPVKMLGREIEKSKRK